MLKNISKKMINSKLQATKFSSSVKRWVESSNPNASSNFYIPVFKLGELINSGREADVFEIDGYDKLVARVKHDTQYSPAKLYPSAKKQNAIFASYDDWITITKKIEGEPLHGKFWKYFSPDVSSEDFLKTLDDLAKLPDKAFVDYIKELKKIRRNGFDIDTINPNNFLLDKKNNKINIVDLTKSSEKKKISMRDFYPFLDSRRIRQVLKNASPYQKYQILCKTHSFIERIMKIGRKHFINLHIEAINKNILQNDIVYIYHYYNNYPELRKLDLM